MKRIEFQLYAGIGGFPRAAMISAVGGLVMVAMAGSATKATLYNADGTSLTNPVTLTSGGAKFYVADTVGSVDLYIMAPGGQFVTKASVKPGEDPDIAVDTTNRTQVAIIPFAAVDQTADNTETDTGFSEPANALFTGIGTAIRVLSVDATETVDVGTDSGDSGDANGFVAAASVAVPGVIVSSGALVISTQDYIPHVGAGKSITYTLSAGADTAEGFIILPYILA